MYSFLVRHATRFSFRFVVTAVMLVIFPTSSSKIHVFFILATGRVGIPPRQIYTAFQPQSSNPTRITIAAKPEPCCIKGLYGLYMAIQSVTPGTMRSGTCEFALRSSGVADSVLFLTQIHFRLRSSVAYA